MKKKIRKKKRKLNKKGIIAVSVIIILLIIIPLGLWFNTYSKTDKYKLSKIGYNNKEIKIIKSLNKKDVETIKNVNYDKNIPKLITTDKFKKDYFKEYYTYQKSHKTTNEETIFIINNDLDENKEYNEELIKTYLNFSKKAKVSANMAVKLVNNNITDSKIISDIQKEKYYKENNLERYINYYEKTKYDIKTIVRNVNANIDYEYYTNIKDADLSKDNLILVNKYYKLDASYEPDDLVQIEGNMYAKKVTCDAYLKMKKDAEKTGLSFTINSAYRSYSTQESLYNNYANTNGVSWAESFSARPGHSEHQTGLALDITSNSSNFDSFENTKEYEWLTKNAHKYGFILRYKKEYQDITGYHYESWHYRYVGVDVATQIYNESITYEEYYEYYINK